MPSEMSEPFPPNSLWMYDVVCLSPLDDEEIAAMVAEMRSASSQGRIEFIFYVDKTSRSEMRIAGAIARAWPGANVQFRDGPVAASRKAIPPRSQHDASQV